MVLSDKISDLQRQTISFCQFKPIRHVPNDYARTGIWIERIVRIHTFLILGEERRPIHFPDVVIKGTYTDKRAVCPDALSCLFC